MRYHSIRFTTDNIIGMLFTSLTFPLWWFGVLKNRE